MSLVPDTDLVREFRHRLTGRVIAPDDDGYDEARTIFYGGDDRRPALIARVADAADVSTLVRLAREGGLELAVRSGGHSVAGHSASDGIVLDLSEMKAIDVDVEKRTAWAQTGFTAAEFTDATAPRGLGVGLGDTGSVGIGAVAGDTMTAAAESEPQAALPREPDHGRDVGRVGHAGDHGRLMVVSAVEDRAGLVVPVVVGSDHAPRQAMTKLPDQVGVRHKRHQASSFVYQQETIET